MLKKSISLLLALCSFFILMTSAAAARESGIISIKLNSDIAGMKFSDSEKLMEIKTENVIYSVLHPYPVSVSDYAGTYTEEPLRAGRTYFINYILSAADGFELPDKLRDGDLLIECEKGVKVISSQIVYARIRQSDGSFTDFKGLNIYAQVTVDGNFLQRIAGFFFDAYLKIRAWSLY